MPPATTNLEKLQILIALIMVFEGFNIAFLSHELTKISEWTRVIGYAMLFGGIGFFIYMYFKKVNAKQLAPPEPKTRLTPRARKAGRKGLKLQPEPAK
jgi:hypothetical protein